MIEFKTFKTESAYNSASFTDTTISKVNDNVKVDGFNICTTEPEFGDLVYLDSDGNKIFYKPNLSSIPTDLTFVGVIFKREGNLIKILGQTFPNYKYCDVLQYRISAISSTSIKIKLHLKTTTGSTDDEKYTPLTLIEVTLSSTNLDLTNADAIAAAIQELDDAFGNSNAWHGYIEDNNIIIQQDTWNSYRLYEVLGTSCTIALASWGDMPASPYYFRSTGGTSSWSGGVINVARAKTYCITNGTTPTSNYTITSGTTYPVTLEAFENSSYCQELRDTYKTYEDYLKANSVLWPQQSGAFSLPKAAELTEKYSNKTVITKTGATKYKFPALHYPTTLGYTISKDLTIGKWHLPDVEDVIIIFEDENLKVIKNSFSAAGVHWNLTNSSYAWTAQRYSANNAWSFSGRAGVLYGSSVTRAFPSCPVALSLIA